MIILSFCHLSSDNEFIHSSMILATLTYLNSEILAALLIHPKFEKKINNLFFTILIETLIETNSLCSLFDL